MSKKGAIFILTPWVSLGFYRGTKYYGRNHNRECIRYEENKNNKYYRGDKPEYFYTSSICFGILGGFLYANPFTFGAVILKEIYRLEVNVRGLNEEKEKDNYHEFF
jgi:hypothetical protein